MKRRRRLGLSERGDIGADEHKRAPAADEEQNEGVNASGDDHRGQGV